MQEVYVVTTPLGPSPEFVEIETPEGKSVRVGTNSGPYPGKEDAFWRIGPLYAPVVGPDAGKDQPVLVLTGDDVWRIYDLATMRAEVLQHASDQVMADVGQQPWAKLQARIGMQLGRPVPCDCPSGMRFHATNCSYLPGEAMA